MQMKQWFSLTFIMALAFQPVAHATANNIYESIQEQHIKSFQLEPNNQWDENSFYKFVVRYFSEQKQPSARKNVRWHSMFLRPILPR